MKIHRTLLVATCLISALAASQAQTWIGTNGTLWSDNANWSTPPIANSTLTFNGTNNTTNTNDLPAGTQFNGISFSNLALTPFTLSGNSVKLGGTLSISTNPASYVLHTVNLDLQLIGNRTMNTRGNGDIAINGNITEDAAGSSLTVGGQGILYLNGTNSFSGNLISTGAEIQINSLADAGVSSAAGAGTAINLGSNNVAGVLTLVTASAQSSNRTILIGDNTANATRTGGTLIANDSAGNATLTFTSADFNTAQATSNAPRTLTLGGTNTGNNTVLGTIRDNSASGVVSLTKADNGKWVLTGNNTYTGNTNITGGTLAAGQSGAFSTGNVSLADTNTTLELANGVVLANTVSVANAGTAKYINLADNAVAATFAGNVTILETSAGNFISSVGANGTLTITGNITGSAGAGLRKEGSGNLTLAGANTYTGQVWISDGTVNVASLAANLGGNTTVKLAQAGGSIGTLRYTGAGETFSRQILIGNANAGTARIVNDGSGALLFDNATFNGEQGAAIPFNRTLSLGGSNAGNNTISGVIANSSNVFIRVTKTDAGKWILAGNNTYTGNTTVAGGTLALGSPFLNDNSTVYLSSNTTLNLDFNGTDTVNALYIDNVQQTNGTWGGTGSGAANTSALITGSGWLDVIPAGGGPSANVTFTSAGQNVAEAAGTAILTVTATGATGDITANVTFDSGNSTASAGDIGSYTTQTVTLNATNSYTANVTVTVTDDSTPEAAETAVFELTDLTGSASLGTPASHTVTIAANDSFSEWAAGYGLNGSLTDNFDGDKFTDGEEYAFDLDPTTGELGNVLASQTALSGGNVTMTLAFNGNSSKQDINYVVRRANNPGFTANTVVGFWNGTANWTTSNSTYFANQTQSGAGDVKDINVNLEIPAASEPRQFLKVNIE